LAAGVLLAAAWPAFPRPGRPAASAPTGEDAADFPRPPEQLSAVIPNEADFKEQGEGHEEEDRPFFDDFAWKNFIALNWPAKETRRAEADPDKEFGDNWGPTVWGSWKSVGELFPPDPLKHPPTPWESFDAVLAARRAGKFAPLADLPREAGKF